MGGKTAVRSTVVGGATALTDAYEAHRDALKQFFIRRLRCPDTAEDLIQDTWLKISRANCVPDVLSNPTAYIFRVASNLATDHVRRESRRAAIIAEVQDLLWEGQDDLTAEKQVMARAELEHIRQSIAEMPLLSRRVFYLNRFRGHTQRQIAKDLGISPSTVENHIRRVLRHLERAQRAFASF